MGKIILVTGGARSGKSKFAEDYTLSLRADASLPAIYIATSEAFDSEMEERVSLHRKRRGAEWKSVEEPLELAQILKETDNHFNQPRLVDCLTLWLNNLIFYQRDIDTELATLIDMLDRQHADVVFVTNEIGSGVVPEHPDTRAFRDKAGLLNQTIARLASEVYLSVSGIAVRIKPSADRA